MKLVLKGKILLFIILTVLSLASGVIHVALLIYINTALNGLLKSDSIKTSFIISTGTLLVVYLLLNRIFSSYLITFSQRTIHDLRMQLMRTALNAEYSYMKSREEQLYSAISKDTVTISHAGLALIQLLSSLATIIACFGYLFYLSFYVFLFIISVAIVGTSAYTLLSKGHADKLASARKNEDLLFYHVHQIIKGFKEIKINYAKGFELIEGPLLDASVKNYNDSSRGYAGYFNSGLIGNSLFYFSLVMLLFTGSSQFSIAAPVLMNCVIVILYLLGPIETSTSLVPQLSVGNISSLRFIEIIDDFSAVSRNGAQNLLTGNFKSLSFRDIIYKYPSKEGEGEAEAENDFAIGPINFELKKGEVVFMYGGNGSGKTTFIYVLLGLLTREAGLIFLNDQLITPEKYFYNIFSPIFSDFYLFDRLYAVKAVDKERIEKYLGLFELNKKVTFNNQRFSSTNLSTGQRKRLALISVLLEDRPILVLDEWAADQDPAFRKKFYTEIVPSLKLEGYTIIAITHDDMYYQCADSLYRMEYGKIIKEKYFQN